VVAKDASLLFVQKIEFKVSRISRARASCRSGKSRF